MALSQAHLFISGRVQGVFYRVFTSTVAARFNLSGWVRNLYDGRVEVLLEGERDAIELAIHECSIGPKGAQVHAVETKWKNSTGSLSRFEIRH